ncbi:hypothetical protein K3495_g5255 [Podosphaera aphanis]|nr:hypothetical protein K3495_g5255 [Podosphaera aphanis]
MIISIKQISLDSDAISVKKKIVDLGTTPIKSEHFQKRFRQYILDCEGNENDWESTTEDEFNDIFNTLAIDKDNAEPTTDCNISMSYNTYFGEISEENAVLTTAEFTIRSCQHALLALKTEPDSPPQYDLFTYNDATKTRYMSQIR